MAKNAWQMKVKRRPTILSHSVNAECNLRCVFCDEWKKKLSSDVISLESDSSESNSSGVDSSGSASSDVPLEDIFKVIDLARDFGILSYNAWSTEPLLRKDLPEIMKYAKSVGMKTFMITNGTLLKKRMNDLGDVDYISVSMDGPTATKEIRGTNYDKIMEGIRYAAESGQLNQPLLMNCVISSKNLDEVVDLLHTAKELGVKMAIEPIYLFKRMNETCWDDLLIQEDQKEQFVDVMNQLIDLKKKGYPIINSKTYLKMVRDQKPISNCKVNLSIMAIDHTENMYNCRIHNKPLGNVLSESVFDENGNIKVNGITEVWNKSKSERMDKIHNCEGCQFFGYSELTLMNNYNIESFYGYEWL
ncbi:GTP 3',8-cyclase [Methanosarcinaceae archaeon Ag5]|uniref:GTP 3',8-cyclase n=2 Tax=Methanolapillus africanus TaxID=3028297 RepID=A0AAE4MJ66_9EURY|nr:GTP 3',8-cyclase [Methanosarcinaceae archaeon Ag5]